MPKRRDRSITPEIQWDAVPSANMVVADVLAPDPIISKVAKKVEQEKKQARKLAKEAERGEDDFNDSSAAQEVAARIARDSESKAWRLLVLRLATLRGNRETERLMEEKHPELARIAEICGAAGKGETTIDKAKEVARGWFVRGLRGSNRQGPAERQRMCEKLSEALEKLIQPYWNSSLDQVTDALANGSVEEGPLVCCFLRKELVQSHYASIWISRVKKGIYIIGDEDDPSLPSHDQDGATIQKPVRVKVVISKGRLLIDGFFNEADEGEMTPAKVAVGPFLSVYFEGAPLKEAMARWKDGNQGRPLQRASDSNGEEDGNRVGGVRPKAGAARGKAAENGYDGVKVTATTTTASSSETLAAITAELPRLPPGWEMRESRSKKGVFYYVNEGKGLSQFERPKA